jgi:hypothetical protein
VLVHTYRYTYHSRFIPEGIAEVSQIFLRDTHVLPKLVMTCTADVAGGKPIAVLLQPISEVKQRWSVIGWVTKNLLFLSVLRKAR